MLVSERRERETISQASRVRKQACFGRAVSELKMSTEDEAEQCYWPNDRGEEN